MMAVACSTRVAGRGEHCPVSSKCLLCLLSARLKRRQLCNKDLDLVRDVTPNLKQGSSQMFRSLRDKGKQHGGCCWPCGDIRLVSARNCQFCMYAEKQGIKKTLFS
jgi:hypothetical protein